MTGNIQFCGGCNPRYDRGAFARRIREAFPDIAFSYNAKTDTDIVLILCGCEAACARVPEEYGPRGRLVVHDEAQWEETVSFLERILKTVKSSEA